MATGKCPRCGSSEFYFAKRQVITGLGGIYGQRARMVKTPLCKACGEVVDYDRRSKRQIVLGEKLKKNKWKFLIAYILFIGAIYLVVSIIQ